MTLQSNPVLQSTLLPYWTRLQLPPPFPLGIQPGALISAAYREFLEMAPATCQLANQTLSSLNSIPNPGQMGS